MMLNMRAEMDSGEPDLVSTVDFGRTGRPTNRNRVLRQSRPTNSDFELSQRPVNRDAFQPSLSPAAIVEVEEI